MLDINENYYRHIRLLIHDVRIQAGFWHPLRYRIDVWDLVNFLILMGPFSPHACKLLLKGSCIFVAVSETFIWCQKRWTYFRCHHASLMTSHTRACVINLLLIYLQQNFKTLRKHFAIWRNDRNLFQLPSIVNQFSHFYINFFENVLLSHDRGSQQRWQDESIGQYTEQNAWRLRSTFHWQKKLNDD